MKKYLRLACSVCKRTVDKLVDNIRYSPDKCTITLRCEGRLFPLEYRSDASITPAPEIGIVDWYQRGTSPSSISQKGETRFIDTSTGEKQQLVLAVHLNEAPADTSSAVLKLIAKDAIPKEFKSYVFRRSSQFTSISGVEDGLSAKTLRFKAWGPTPDDVKVYLNGVLLSRGTGVNDYQLDDGTVAPPAPSNTVKFNSPILPDGIFQVEIVVSKFTEAEPFIVTFSRNRDDETRLYSGAWENVSHITRFNGVSSQNFYLFTFDVFQNTILPVDSVLFPYSDATVTGFGDVPLESCFFVFARKPYSHVDRYNDVGATLSSLNSTSEYLKYHNKGDSLVLEISESSLSTHFPSSTVHRFNPELTIKTEILGDSEQLVVDGKVIVGPDI